MVRSAIRLYSSPTTPFGRKVLLVAHELGLADRLEVEAVETASDELARVNPLSKIPALILDDGSSLYDSRVICEYLDHLAGGNRLHPAPGPARWDALRLQALADGVSEAAVLRLLESRRPPAIQWPDWHTRQQRKITQSLDLLERTPPPTTADIGTLSLLAALGYLDFRFAPDPWRTPRPRLAAWFASFSARASYRATAPQG